MTTESGRREAAPQVAERQERRADIQALRALAVSLVLVFHLAPGFLSGGYVGVDVFFVISGFLITGHLLSAPPRRFRDLANFWSRRIARLLPAAVLVLLATLAASRLLGPETRWEDTAGDVYAAGFYVVNWRFADHAVVYMAAANLPSPVLHYWSLSVEEQFYAGWPILVMVLFALGALTRVEERALRRLVIAGLATVTTASFLWSLHLTDRDPARAYFVLPTRIWELGAGGVLAAVSWRIGPRALDARAVRVRGALTVTALAAITWSAWAFSGATPFPGWRALVPVLGTVVVIAARPPGALGRALAVRPVQFLGDISYSLYLWHWPLIVLVPMATGRPLSAGARVLVLLAALLLGAWSKRYVEDPFQRPRTRRPVVLRFAGAGMAMALLAGLVWLQTWEVEARTADARLVLAAAASRSGPCFGAAALAEPGCARGGTGPAAASPTLAAQDKSQAYPDVPGGRPCLADVPYPPTRCDFGPPGATTRIALVGNSHAAQWLPALQVLADQKGWRITTFVALQCAVSEVPQKIVVGPYTDQCSAWVRRVVSDVAAGHFDAVVVSNRLSAVQVGRTREGSTAGYARGYRAVLEDASRQGIWPRLSS